MTLGSTICVRLGPRRQRPTSPAIDMGEHVSRGQIHLQEIRRAMRLPGFDDERRVIIGEVPSLDKRVVGLEILMMFVRPDDAYVIKDRVVAIAENSYRAHPTRPLEETFGSMAFPWHVHISEWPSVKVTRTLPIISPAASILVSTVPAFCGRAGMVAMAKETVATRGCIQLDRRQRQICDITGGIQGRAEADPPNERPTCKSFATA